MWNINQQDRKLDQLVKTQKYLKKILLSKVY